MSALHASTHVVANVAVWRHVWYHVRKTTTVHAEALWEHLRRKRIRNRKHSRVHLSLHLLDLMIYLIVVWTVRFSEIPHFVVVVFDGEFGHLRELDMQSVAAVVDVLVVEEGFRSCCFFSVGVLNESMVLVVTDERHNLLYLTTSVEHLLKYVYGDGIHDICDYNLENCCISTFAVPSVVAVLVVVVVRMKFLMLREL